MPTLRVRRGGSFTGTARGCRCAYRVGVNRAVKGWAAGFPLTLDLNPE